MAGGMYIWIIGAFFLLTIIVILLFAGFFGLGHWFDRKGGARHKFLERPAGAGTKDLPVKGDSPSSGPSQ